MMHKMSFKNEKIFAFSIDLLVLTLFLSITYVLFEYPRIFPYFKEVQAAKEMLDPQAYTATMDQLNQRFDYVLLQICTAYFLYESIGLILFRQTVGRRLYHKKVYLNFESRYDLVLRIAILPVRTLVKLLCVVWVFPVILIGAVFMLGKKDRTLLDICFLTETRREAQYHD